MLIEDFKDITCPIHGVKMDISYVDPARKVAGYGIKQVGVYQGDCGCFLKFDTDPKLMKQEVVYGSH